MHHILKASLHFPHCRLKRIIYPVSRSVPLTHAAEWTCCSHCTGESALGAKRSTCTGTVGTASMLLCSRTSKMFHLELKETSTETKHESWQLKGRKIKAMADRSSSRLLLYLPPTPRSADPGRTKGMSTSNHPPPFHFIPELIAEISTKHVTFRRRDLSSFLLRYPQKKLTWHLESEVYPDTHTLKTVAGPHCHSAPVQTLLLHRSSYKSKNLLQRTQH